MVAGCGRKASAYISTRSTFMPHCSVASSRICCMLAEITSRSVRISDSVFVPSTLRSVVCASSFVLWCAFCAHMRQSHAQPDARSATSVTVASVERASLLDRQHSHRHTLARRVRSEHKHALLRLIGMRYNKTEQKRQRTSTLATLTVALLTR